MRERHTKLEEFGGWLGVLKRVQAQEGQRQQQEETALALWDMYLAYGGKSVQDQQEKFDEMKEDSAVFQKVALCCCWSALQSWCGRRCTCSFQTIQCMMRGQVTYILLV